MSNKEELNEAPPNAVILAAAGLTINEVIAETKPKEVKPVKDHYICYGKKVAICGVELGGRGLIADKTFITCPNCRELMYNAK